MSEQARSHDDDVSALKQELAEHEAELSILGSVQQALASRFEVLAIYDLIGNEVRDIFDVFSMVDGKIGLIIADACDKGLGAELFMILFRSLIRAASNVEFFTRADPEGNSECTGRAVGAPPADDREEPHDPALWPPVSPLENDVHHSLA